jgi:hypothetical protein
LTSGFSNVYLGSCHGYKRRIRDSTQYTKIPAILVWWVQMGKKWIYQWTDVSLYFYDLQQDGQYRYCISMLYMQTTPICKYENNFQPWGLKNFTTN